MKLQPSLGLISLLLTACGPSRPIEKVEVHRIERADFSLSKRKLTSLTKENSISFVVFGDFGTGSESQIRVAKAMKQKCDELGCQFALGTGDNIYPAGAGSLTDSQWRDKFERPYESFGEFPFWMILGNHDWGQSIWNEIDYTRESARWLLPHFHYAIPNLPSWLKIYGMDTSLYEESLPISEPERQRMISEQTQSVKRHLCTNDEAQLHPWKILFAHHPLYSSGPHGRSEKAREALEPLIEECQIDFYFSGHDHHQEHLKPQVNSHRFHHLIQGAGASTRPLKTLEASSQFASTEIGFAWIQMKTEIVKIEFHSASQKIYEVSVNRSQP